MSRDELLGRFSKATEYLIRPAFTARALVWRGELRPGLLGVAFALSTLDALSDETRQLFVPGRGFELIDLTLDLGGFAIGVPHMGSS